MDEHKRFVVIETDARQQAAATALRRWGYSVEGTDSFPYADYILLPLLTAPIQQELPHLFQQAKKNALFFAGRVTAEQTALATQRGVLLIDYFARKDLILWNTIPTAEGCLELLFRHRTHTLWGSPLLLLGYGNVARALAVRLAALGGQVTIAARSSIQQTEAQTLGLDAIPLAKVDSLLPHVDTVINTIPALVLTKPLLSLLPQNSLIIDLASDAGGTDLAAAKCLGHHAIHALGLPARCAPDSAGRYLAQTVLQILSEREANPSCP